MSARIAMLAAGLGLLLLQTPALAHHSFAAEYDDKQPVKLQGTVSKVVWLNPHTHFYIDVKDETGKVTTWNFEMSSPNALMRNGWTSTSVKIGDGVTVEGYKARDGSSSANARVVLLADGRRVFAGSSGGDQPK